MKPGSDFALYIRSFKTVVKHLHNGFVAFYVNPKKQFHSIKLHTSLAKNKNMFIMIHGYKEKRSKR